MDVDNSRTSGAKRSAGEAMNELRLSAARKRLSESRDEADAIEGLREIVANLLGSEEIGLFKLDPVTTTFQACWSFGADLENYDLMQALGDAGLQRVLRGECRIDFVPSASSRTASKAQAFIPLRVENQTVAIIAILRLLPQKTAFDAADMELFQLLSDEAGKPLFDLTGKSKRVAAKGITA